MGAAKPPQVLVERPPSRHDDDESSQVACAMGLFCVAMVTLFVLLFVFISHFFPEEDPVYSAVITGVAGLDLADVSRSPAAPLSPVFNLTLQIDNTRNAMKRKCVPSLSTAAVSYRNAFLGGSSVPPFCAGKRRSERVAAQAWGDAVAVPRFLRERLAGELAAGGAEVDVKVTMPNFCGSRCVSVGVLSCKVNVRGGPPSPCLVDYLDNPLPLRSEFLVV